MFKRVKKNKKGFTLAELLIVVAIIAVLVAISIPIFTSQLEKSREATDQANLRAAYAECSAAVLSATDPGTGYTYTNANGVITCTTTYACKQTKAGWVNGGNVEIGGVNVAGPKNDGAGATYTITVTDDGSAPVIAEQ